MILINCENKILGRISSIISKLIINFNFFKKNFFFFLFNINYIIIKKKFFFSHSGYIGNEKIVKKKNIQIVKKCIFKMLPKNKNRIILMKKIFFFENKII
ncbi:MAG: uL13 family ribosomal protein [Candidatus Carsonella ruddii]